MTEPVKSYRLWSNDIIINKLKEITEELNHFPTMNELQTIGRYDLINVISKHGGLNKFRKIFGYEPLHKPDGFWNDEIIVNDLAIIKNNIGHFPCIRELKNEKRTDLIGAIAFNGGIRKFRKLLNSELNQKPDGYWTIDNTIIELKRVIKEINHFPSSCELYLMNKSSLSFAITKHGGFTKFRELLGYSISIQELYRSELMSYTNKRGKNSEIIVKRILIDYCDTHNLSTPIYNHRFSNNSIIEFVCNTGKTIGIDVTNTDRKSQVSRKWTHKSYHKYLDELWIVVFSNVFTKDDYIKWNTESPDNVKIFSIRQFLEELDYSLDEHTKQKIDKYCSCTFHTKEELKISHSNGLKY